MDSRRTALTPPVTDVRTGFGEVNLRFGMIYLILEQI